MLLGDERARFLPRLFSLLGALAGCCIGFFGELGHVRGRSAIRHGLQDIIREVSA
jgi:hypothetical protein